MSAQRIHAVIYDISTGEPRKLMTARASTLNRNLAAGQTWREVGWDVLEPDAAPAFASLLPHPDLVEPD